MPRTKSNAQLGGKAQRLAMLNDSSRHHWADAWEFFQFSAEAVLMLSA